jgi:putative hydrolase of the HAD superfamily
VWLFDLDDTLHDASRAVFAPLRDSMTAYIQRELGLPREEANLLRIHYWRRYGATLLGLIRHHGVRPAHFLADTHQLPGLEQRLWACPADRAALWRLPGWRCVLTNAPRAYALRVLRQVGLLQAFDAVICIEDMSMFGHLRPKPDARFFRHLMARLRVKASDCVLIEDTLVHQKAAHRVGMRTVWMQRFWRQAAAAASERPRRLARRPAYVDIRIQRLRELRNL